MKKTALSGLLLILVIGLSLSSCIPLYVATEDTLVAKWAGGSGAPPWAVGNGEDGEGGATGVVSYPPISDRWALIIGISDYAGTESDLEYSDDDALELLTALIDVYNYQRDHIFLLISDYFTNNATRSDIIGAIDWLRTNEGEDSEVVFYFSGHGVRGLRMDEDPEKIDEGIVTFDHQYVWDGELAEEFSDFDTTRFFICFDTCYAGGMDDVAGPGRVVCMACRENKLSYEGSTWGNGQFTYYFVDQAMLNQVDMDEDGYADADSNKDELVTVEEAFDYANLHCKRQDPGIDDQFEDDMLL